MHQRNRVPLCIMEAYAEDADRAIQATVLLSHTRNSSSLGIHTLGDPFLGESSMAVSLLEGLLSADDLADEQAAVSRGYREEPFSHACASRIFSSMEKRCRFSSRGTCTEGEAFNSLPRIWH